MTEDARPRLRMPVIHSLFGRLLLIFVLTLAGGAMVALATYHAVMVENPRNHLTQRLLFYAIEGFDLPPSDAQLSHFAQIMGGIIVVRGPAGFLWRSEPIADLPNETPHPPPGRPVDIIHHGAERWAALRYGDYTYYMFDPRAAMSSEAATALLVGLFALLVLAFLNFRAVSWLFRPIRDLKAGAERIGQGELAHRVDCRRRDELGELTTSVNLMAANLQQQRESRQQLLLAIGHELRTPLARAKLILELMGSAAGEDREPLARNIDEIAAMVDALLEAERLSDGGATLVLETVALGDLIRDAVAPDEAERVIIEWCDEKNWPVQQRKLSLDRLRIRLAIRNLLSNALKYGGPGPVTLRLRREGQQARIEVLDGGDGIAPDHLAQMGQPFWRPDQARQRKTGGTGLGLYLTRRIIEAHGGRMELASGREGTMVSLVLPLPQDMSA